MPNSIRGESARYPMPAYPRGWYCVCDAAELAVGEIKPLRLFGQELVAARAEDGAVGVFDAIGCFPERTDNDPASGFGVARLRVWA